MHHFHEKPKEKVQGLLLMKTTHVEVLLLVQFSISSQILHS